MSNVHNFKLNLPLDPHGAATAIEMDGKELNGVTSICVRAGFNGHTNVAIELITSAAIEMVAALLVDLKEGAASERQALFAAIYMMKPIGKLSGSWNTMVWSLRTNQPLRLK